MSTDLLAALQDAVRSASATSLRADLIPAAGMPGDERLFVLPPTYANVGHLVSPERPDGTHEYVLIDSPQSWANRLEELLDEPAAGLPRIEVEVDGRVLTVNQLPHRIFDAVLRDSERAGEPFRATALGRSLTDARASDATALLQHAPATLLFGAWDSFAGAKIGAAKWPAALSGQMLGFDATLAKKGGMRIDPVGVAVDGVTAFRSTRRAEQWTEDLAHAEKDDNGKPKVVRPSEVGHGFIPAANETKGAWVRKIELRSALSLTRLRRYHFPVDGTQSDAADDAARTYLAALALWAMSERIGRGLELRAGAELDARSAEWFLRRPLTPDQPLQVEPSAAMTVLQAARRSAEAAGFKFGGADRFKASALLEKAIRASRESSQ
jgi:CRISPR-associated protein Csb1